MGKGTINVYDVVSDIQARKERFRIAPAHATFSEIKAELKGIDAGALYALLDCEVDGGMLQRRRTINGYAYTISEE